MRFACLYIPGFLIQTQVRRAPHLGGTAFAVVAETAGKVPRVIAASRAALAEGVKLGMTTTQARAVASAVRTVDADPAGDAQVLAALGEAVMALSVTVEVPKDAATGHVWALVPPGARGASFGERLLGVAGRLGLVGRVGIADDRFTAWAATQAEPRQPVRAVASGGSAAFLAPLPLERLPLDPDVRSTLKLLGVKTVGDFAALPAPSVGRRWQAGGVDAQALARGEDRRPLVAFTPSEAVHEQVDLEHEVRELEPLGFVLRPLCERVAARLAGRGTAAARVAVRLTGPAVPEDRQLGEDLFDHHGGFAPAPPEQVRRGPHPLTPGLPGGAARAADPDRRFNGGSKTVTTEVVIAPARPTAAASTLVDLVRAHLAEKTLEHGATRVAVEVLEEGEAPAATLDLFARGAAAPGAVDVTVARLRAVFGAEAVSGAALVDRHRPEAAWAKVAFVPPGGERGGEPRKKQRGLRRGAPRRAGMVMQGGPGEPHIKEGSRSTAAAVAPAEAPKRTARSRAAQLPAVGTVLPLFVRTPGALRLLDPPAPVVELAANDAESESPPAVFHIGGAEHHVASAAGPTRLEAEWWTDEPLRRDYYEVVTHEGGHYWIYRDRAGGGFYLHGVWD